MLRMVLVAGMAGLLSTAAIAQDFGMGQAPEPTTNASMTADPSATDPDKVVCKNAKPPTGTRVRSGRTRNRICLTRREWDEQERAAQEALKVRDSGTCSPGQCGG